MNRLEFEEILKTLNISESRLFIKKDKFGNYRPVYNWNDLEISFNKNNYAIIEGKIPFDFAQKIYDKYSKFNDIKINGNNKGPIDNAIDDIYLNEINKNTKRKLQKNQYQEEKRNLKQRPNENKYITSYYVYSKEALVALLLEMMNYYNNTEINSDKYNDFIAQLNNKILNRVKPNVPINKWVKINNKNTSLLANTMVKMNNSSYGKEIRKLLDEFDKTVNPFINKDIELDDPINYTKNVNIEVFGNKDIYRNLKNTNYYIEITDLNSDITYYPSDENYYIQKQNYVKNYVKPNGFLYELDTLIDKGIYYNLKHYYNVEEGEIIEITYYGLKEYQISYNLSKDIITMLNDNLDEEEKKEIIKKELQKAIYLTSKITTNNMIKKDNKVKILK